ncbi:MAG: hypothetical protein WBZ31_14675 [Thiobacillus sp.]
MAFSPEQPIRRRMALYWGVQPRISPAANTRSKSSSSQPKIGLFSVCASFSSACGSSRVSSNAMRSCASSACSRPPRREVMNGMPAASSARS